MNCRMPYGSHSYVPHTSLGLDNYQHRNNSMSAYSYPPPKLFYGMPPMGEYADESLDYNVHGAVYPILGTENLGLPSYNLNGAPRGWSATPQLSRNSLFIDSNEATYLPGQVPYHGNGYPLRTSISEPKHLPLRDSYTSNLPLTAPIPTVPTSVDRLLPIPASNRQVQAGTYIRPSENGLPNLQQTSAYSPYPGDYIRPTRQAQNTSAVSENGSLSSSYVSLSSNSPESIASSQITYSTPAMSINHQQQSEMYTPPSSDGLYQNESSESSYGHSNSGSRKASQVSQSSNSGCETALPPPSDMLANGQRYVPYQSPTGYPTPPLGNNNMGGNLSGEIVHSQQQQQGIRVD